MTARYKVMREGRYWQVWDTELQQCKGQYWTKKVAEERAVQLANGIDVYARD